MGALKNTPFDTGLDLEKLTEVFASQDIQLLEQASKDKRKSIRTVLKYITNGCLTRASTAHPRSSKKPLIPWKKIRKYLSRINPFPFTRISKKMDFLSQEKGAIKKIQWIGCALWLILAGIFWSIIFFIPVACLLLLGTFVFIEEKVSVAIGRKKPRKNLITIKTWMMRNALWTLVMMRQQPILPPILLRYPMGIKWLGLLEYINSLITIDERTAQLLNYFTGSRPFFNEEENDDEDYYGYLTHNELVELVAGFERYPEMTEHPTAKLMVDFFNAVAKQNKALWYAAV